MQEFPEKKPYLPPPTYLHFPTYLHPLQHWYVGYESNYSLKTQDPPE